MRISFKGDDGWSFVKEGQDPNNSANHLYELYAMSKSDFTGRVSVPVLWDKEKKVIVNNESEDIMRIFNSEFSEFAKSDVDYYPKDLSHKINTMNQLVYTVNIGVYKSAFATSQQDRENFNQELFTALDDLDGILEKNKFLLGNKITEADIRLFVTLIRFDKVYNPLFRCDQRRISSYKHLNRHLEQLSEIKEISETINWDEIIGHYYQSFLGLNPSGKNPTFEYESPISDTMCSL